MERLYREPSEATKQKMSLKKQGCLTPNYGKPSDEATRQAISDKMKAYWQTVPSKYEEGNFKMK